jgi:hypothetical protein
MSGEEKGADGEPLSLYATRLFFHASIDPKHNVGVRPAALLWCDALQSAVTRPWY